MTARNSLLVRAVCLLVLAGTPAWVRPPDAHAQRLAAPLPRAWDAPESAVPGAYAVRVDRPRRDYRWLGTAVGAVALGLAAGLEARAACGNSENGPRDCTGVTVGVGALGAAVGGAVGNLVGRVFKRG